jgi:hypothetical protein
MDIVKEVWKDVPNYEGIYQVSNLGRVKSLYRVIERKNNKKYTVKGKMLSPGLNTQGYEIVVLKDCGHSSTKRVHQLVAMAFLNHTPCGYDIVVDHIDNNPRNNCTENLQLISQRENASKDRRSKSGVVGVYWYDKLNKWVARITIKNKQKHLGYFKCIKDAEKAYKVELNRLNK